MTFALTLVVALVVAFLFGSIPCGVLVGKAFYGIDPRQSGSKSIGATNVNRTMGTKAGVAVMVLDMLKGVAAVGLARLAVSLVGLVGWQADLVICGSVTFGVMGHIFSPWLGFKGGKGISTGFGTLVTASPAIGLGILVVFAIFAVISRTVSVGSIAAAISVSVFVFLFHWGSIPFEVLGVLTSVLVVFAHRSNIKRLIKGEEPKFSLNTKKTRAAASGQDLSKKGE